MFVRMTTLQHWKSEHDASSCEDAVLGDPAPGLFALADGAGTTLFSNIWARVLVTSFLQTPLLSNDPFEVEWWVRQAQERYQQEAPTLPTTSWNALQKARSQGSHSTLAALRLLHADEQSVQAQFLAIGDSCLLLRKAGERQFQAFPYTRPEEFEAAPICLPSMLSLFDRTFHRVLLQPVLLEPGDQVILATDAVARWIISAGKGSCSGAEEAFQVVAEQTPESWTAFIEDRRVRGEMVDDDSTALSLVFTAQAAPDVQEAGVTTEHRSETRADRKQAFLRARQEESRELQAIYYGDGVDLVLEGIQITPEERDLARQVADALRAVLTELRKTLQSADMVPSMRQVWTRYAPLLETEPCAANLRKTLTQRGVLPLPSAVSPSAAPEPEQQPSVPAPTGAAASQASQQSQPAPAAILSEDASEPSTDEAGDQQKMLQDSLASRSIEQMATAYSQLQADVSFLTAKEREQLELAHRFKMAFDANHDEELFAIYTRMLQGGYLSCFDLNGLENERIAIIGHRKEPPQQPGMRSELWRAGELTISESRFRKACLVKSFYVLYKEQRLLPPEQIERLVVADLTNEKLILRGIAEINRAKSNRAKKKMAINWQRELPGELKRFQNAQKQNYQILTEVYQISKEELSEIVALFLRSQLLAEHLRNTAGLSLQNWVELQRRSELEKRAEPGGVWPDTPGERRST